MDYKKLDEVKQVKQVIDSMDLTLLRMLIAIQSKQFPIIDLVNHIEEAEHIMTNMLELIDYYVNKLRENETEKTIHNA